MGNIKGKNGPTRTIFTFFSKNFSYLEDFKKLENGQMSRLQKQKCKRFGGQTLNILFTIKINLIFIHWEIVISILVKETPGKADVVVVIAADPDGHEVCFVGDEAFRELSATDPASNKAIDAEMEKDKSNQWLEKLEKRNKKIEEKNLEKI